jgi:hypothetical protein
MGTLLINQKKIAITGRKILSYSLTVNEEISFGSSLRFQAQIEDLTLK